MVVGPRQQLPVWQRQGAGDRIRVPLQDHARLARVSVPQAQAAASPRQQLPVWQRQGAGDPSRVQMLPVWQHRADVDVIRVPLQDRARLARVGVPQAQGVVG